MSSSREAEAEASDPSYIDYELFLSPSFSAPAFANTLVLSTNNPSDTPLDLSTPLSRVLFDIQEVDSHIHTLSSASALPLLSYTQSQTEASSRIVTELSSQVASLNDSYKRLEKEIIGRYEAAEEVRKVSERLWHTVRLGRAVGRALQLGRQLEIQMNELHAQPTSAAPKAREDHRAMVRASNTILATRVLFDSSTPDSEGALLSRVNVITTLQSTFLNSERTLRTKAQQVIREFSMSTLSTTTTYSQTEETKSRTNSALLTLYLLSSQPKQLKKLATFDPDILILSLQEFLRTSLTSSLASLSRALGSLPTLDRTLLEISARCQNITALEILLESIKPPPFTPETSLANPTPPSNLLAPLLQSLETSSLPSYFWRSLASALSPKVVELLQRGGVQARTLKSNKSSVRDAIRDCVVRGSQPPAGAVSGGKGKSRGEGWEREVGVMAGAVIGHLGK